MGLLRALHGRRKRGWAQHKIDEPLLVFDRQADDLGFIDRPMGNLLRGGNHEIADAASLDFRGALNDPERIGGDARFDPGGAGRFLGHVQLYGIMPDSSTAAKPAAQVAAHGLFEELEDQRGDGDDRGQVSQTLRGR